MSNALIKYGLIGAGLLGVVVLGSMQGTSVSNHDLRQVLERTDKALNTYEISNADRKIDAAEMGKFSAYLTGMINAEPALHKTAIGLDLGEDAKFTAFEDVNANRVREEDENRMFTIELDSRNRRLIATDISGEAMHHRYSGSGLVAGLLIGRLISRQRAAGIPAGAFETRRTKSTRASERARSRSRSGGSRSGK